MSYSSSVQGVGLLLSLSNSILPGCTDPTAFNYNPAATLNDNSCIAVVNGCTEPTAFNYDASANVDSSFCTWAGCTDPTAFNYNSVIVANASIYGTTATNDGTCIAIVNGCTDPASFNYNSSANTNDGSCIAVVLGCTNSAAFNYNALANTDDGSCIAVVNGCTDPSASNYNALANIDNGSCVWLGCTDPSASNYNPLATTDDGSCIACVYGCTDSNATNYNATATCDDGSCIPYTYGCMDPSADNYNSTVVIDDNTCVWLGCTDLTASNYGWGTGNANIWTSTQYNQTDNGSCTYTTCSGTAPITGNYATTTTNGATINWDNMNIGLCTVDWYQIRYKVSGAWTNLLSTTTNSQNISNLIPATTYEYEMKIKYVGSASAVAWANNPSGQFTTSSCPPGQIELYGQCVPAIYGCTDPTACNSNGSANVDNGTCTYPAVNADCLGCLSSYTLVNGACVSIVYGCTDSTQFNYSASANVDDGSCIPIIMGCTNPTATNYDASANANTNDGSCTFQAVVVGCMDQNACNYNAAATTTQPHDNKTLCVHPIPNAYITVGGTDPNYGQTGPAYFNTGSPIANTAKFVKHAVINDWPLGTVQQQDMGLSFRWGEPGADMFFSFVNNYSQMEKITVNLYKESDPTDASNSWNSVYTKDYDIPDWTATGNQIGQRNYSSGTTNAAPYSYPEPFGSDQNASNNYKFYVYYNATVKNRYRVEITQAHYNPISNVLSTWGGYTGLQSPAGNVNCGGRFEFEIQDLPCSSMDPNLVIYGCTDISACNYDMYATCDDGSCIAGQVYYDCANSCAPCEIVSSGCNQALPNCSQQGLGPLYPNTFTSQSQCFAFCAATY
jgi:hypothetical protein